MERFHDKIAPEPIGGGCWIWVGSLDSKGYGNFRNNGKVEKAYRVSYQLHKGPIPVGLELDHLCRLPCCVNPDHLEAVTRRENVMRGRSPKLTRARQLAKTHCPKGHPYSGENLYTQPDGRRRCRKCAKVHWYAHMKRKNELKNND